MIHLFASIYSKLTNPFSDLVADYALDIHGCSRTASYETNDSVAATALFQESREYYAFCERFSGRDVYTYLINSDGTVCRADLD